MDEDNLRNWGYYEPPPPHPPLKGGLGLNLMTMSERDTTKPSFLSRDHPIMVSTNPPYHPHPPPHHHMEYVRDDWLHPHRGGKIINMFPTNHHYSHHVLPESSGGGHPHSMQQMIHQQQPEEETKPHIIEEEEEDPPTQIKKETGPAKKRASSSSSTPKAPKSKKPRKGPVKENGNVQQRAKTVKKNVEVVINGVDMDITGIPIPVCSCTGSPQQCYRWGCGGWQSACCTTTISMYPLPMSTKRRGARIAGRKMSQGAFKKVLEKLAGEGYNFANPIDLRTYWAKHGTNKFVVIR